MVSSEDCPIDYEPNHFYTVEEFLALNDWLETHEFIVDGIPISHFERESDGRLVPIPPAVFIKEAAVGEIFGQLRDWNINTRQKGFPISLVSTSAEQSRPQMSRLRHGMFILLWMTSNA